MAWNDIKTGSSTLPYTEYNDMVDYIESTGSNLNLATGSLTTINNTVNIHTGSLLSMNISLGSKLTDIIYDTTPELGGEMYCGSNSIEFAEQYITISSGSATIDWRRSNKAYIPMTGSNITTFTWTAPSLGATNLTLRVKQDNIGSRTIAWPTSVVWSGSTAPTLTTTGNKTDIMTFLYVPSIGSYYGSALLNF